MSGAQASAESLPCKICSGRALLIGSRRGVTKPELFKVFRCDHCGYVFVGNPWLDYQEIYSEAYYNGHGADTSVDYVFELNHPQKTIRQYEWRGIVRLVGSCFRMHAGTRWLDFGCGNGGLVRYCRERVNCAMFGYEEGWIGERAAKLGIPILNRGALEELKGTFDIVTAIEVLEHTVEPVEELRLIRGLLKPGGLFFFTTGNAAAHRDGLLEWPYLAPEVHISLFEPRTLMRALQQAGFRAELCGFLPGYDDIIRFKILKALQARKAALWEKALPWRLLSRIVNSRLQLAAHPIGWAE